MSFVRGDRTEDAMTVLDTVPENGFADFLPNFMGTWNISSSESNVVNQAFRTFRYIHRVREFRTIIIDFANFSASVFMGVRILGKHAKDSPKIFPRILQRLPKKSPEDPTNPRRVSSNALE